MLSDETNPIQNEQASDSDQSLCRNKSVESFLNGELAEYEAEKFENHLASCKTCQTKLEAVAADVESWAEAKKSLRSYSSELSIPKGLSNSGQMPITNDDAPKINDLTNASDPSHSNEEFDLSKHPLSRLVLRDLAPTDDPEMLGRLGFYEVAGVIGEGAMGVVLKAHDPTLNRFVAVKVLSPLLAACGASRQRFFREARAAATVAHENVVPIHGVAESMELPYLVMPYVRGESLQSRISQDGHLGVSGIVRVGMQIASGLAAAHSQGLVHRDIKPANILLEEGVERLQITDFGLARAVDDASLTQTGVIAGTPEYMSPEQANGNTIDERSDLFSLGSVMYACCTGHSPFRAGTSMAALRRITDSQPRPIREINSDIPQWLEAFIMKLLAKNPDDRFESADETATILKRCLAHVQHPTSIELPEEVKKLTPNGKSNKRFNGHVEWISKWDWAGATAAIAVIAIGAMAIGSMLWNGESGDPIQKRSSIVRDANAIPQGKTPPSNEIKSIENGQLEQVSQMRSEHFLPATTDVWISISDTEELSKRFGKTQIGKLFSSDEMQPFSKRAKLQSSGWLADNKLNLGLDLLKNMDWISGEACLAFSWASDAKGAKGSIEQALIAKVSESNSEAEKWLEMIFVEATQRGSVQSQFNVGDYSVTKIVPPQGVGNDPAFYSMTDDWLFATDNETSIRELLSKASQKNLVAANALSRQASFKTAMDRSFIPGTEAHVRWFVDPINCNQILNHLFEDDEAKNDNQGISRVLKNAGFDVFTGVGGCLSFDSLDHELLHRMFICTHVHGDEEAKQRQRSVLKLFNFDNQNIVPLHPPKWVPKNVASCLVANWDPSSAHSQIGKIYDAFLRPGDFARLETDLKADPTLRFDLLEFASSFDRRFVHYAYSLHPLMPTASNREQEVWGFKIKKDPEQVLETVKNIDGAMSYRRYSTEGFEFFESKESDKEFGLPVIEDTGNNIGEPEFQETIYANVEGNLVVGREMEAVLPIAFERKKGLLSECDDYQDVYNSLAKLTNEKNISFRQFARLDKAYWASFELLRNGDLVWSDLNWLLSVYDRDPKTQQPNKMQFDGSTLPANYLEQIAPFLGPSGWVIETEQDGWRVTGCVLKK